MKSAGIALLCLALLCPRAQAHDVHGASDAFAGEGVAIVWGVLRGATEDGTVVVLRLAADARRYSQVEVAGVDPFTRDTKIRFAASALGAGLDVRLSRAGFASHPRTELRFSGAESLLVYYLGIPDTAPEFASAAALEAHLAARLGQLK
jgi:hypothetical protein